MEKCRGRMIDINFWNNKTVLITGYSGFKGYWLNLFLKKLGSNVYGISKKGLESEVFKAYSHILNHNNNYEIDISKYDKFEKLLHDINPEILFHFAAQPLVITSKYKPRTTLETNVIGTFNILEAVKNFSSSIATVIATTDKVYKNPSHNNSESDPLGSFELYGATKVACENLINAYNLDKSSSNKFSVVRSGNVLGPGDGGDNRLLTDIILAIKQKKNLNLRNPYSTRPWQFILDSLAGYILAAQFHHHNSYEIFNLGSKELNNVTVFELSEKLLKKFDSNIEIIIEKDNLLLEADILKINSSKAEEIIFSDESFLLNFSS